ncbi:MAG: hypothetical protein DRO15_06250 [Thermoprotei archaeon]|nr:MAG: hypothetical protein DRO15_06250 [Thermoprotei archaeon]
MSLPIVVGHRANTLRTINRYLKAGVKVLEVDVRRRSGDGLVLIHGPTSIKPASIFETILIEMDYVLFSGDPFLRPIPLEIALLMISGKADVWLDVKDKGIERDIVRLLDRINFKGHVYISSCYHAIIRNIKRLRPDIIGAITLRELPVDIVSVAKLANADMISVELSYVDRDLVNYAHKHGLKVAVWTVNDVKLAKKFAEMGVDMIVSDKPATIIKAFKEEQVNYRKTADFPMFFAALSLNELMIASLM